MAGRAVITPLVELERGVQKERTLFAYVGSLTGQPGGSAHEAPLSVFHVDAGLFTLVQRVTQLQSPTYLATHPKRHVLYAAERHWPPLGPHPAGDGSMTSFEIHPAEGHLTPLNSQACATTAHISVHPDGRYVFAAMHRACQVAAFLLNDDGSVDEVRSARRHQGRGPRSPIQDRPFPHSVYPDPSGKRLFSCDLGIDRVMVYDFDEAAGSLEPAYHPYGQLSSGSGPRHLSFHPNGRFVYVVSELASTISIFRYDSESAALSIAQTISTLPENFEGKNAAAHVLVHPSGRFVYASNRGHNTMAVFAVHNSDGRLSLLRHEPTMGRLPHDFTIDETGKVLVVVNRGSGNVVSFRIDQEGGRLEPTGYFEGLPDPFCVVLRPEEPHAT